VRGPVQLLQALCFPVSLIVCHSSGLRRKDQPTVYKSAAVCSSALVVNRIHHIFWAESGLSFVLVRHWLSVVGSNVGSRSDNLALLFPLDTLRGAGHLHTLLLATGLGQRTPRQQARGK